MLDRAAVDVDQAGYADPDGAGQLLAGREPQRLDHAGGGRPRSRRRPARSARGPRRRIVPSASATSAEGLGGADVETDAQLAARHRSHPVPSSSSVTARPRGTRGAARADPWATGRRTGRASPTRPRPPRGRSSATVVEQRAGPRGGGARRAPGRRAAAPAGSAGERVAARARPRGRRGSPHGTSPTAMLARCRRDHHDGAAQVGQLALDRDRPARPGQRRLGHVERRGAGRPRSRLQPGDPVGGLDEPLLGQPPGRGRPPRRPPAPRARGPRPCRRRGRAGRRRRARDSTAASGMPRPPEAPAMSRASVTTTPSKPSCSRSSDSTCGLSVAGSSGSSARHDEVGGHHRRDAGVGPRPRTAPARGRPGSRGRVDDRQREVAVLVGVAVAREVLDAGGDAGLLEPDHPGRDVRGRPVPGPSRSCGCRSPGCRRCC